MTHVLLIEDRLSILHALEDKLTAAGYEVTAASTMNRAIEGFEHHKPDIIVADYRLDTHHRDRTGLAFLRHIGHTRGKIPVIMLSATDWETIKKENPDADTFNVHYVRKNTCIDHEGGHYTVDNLLLALIKQTLRGSMPQISIKPGDAGIAH